MVNVGIIGSGFGLYGLLPAFNSTPECKVTSICGEKTERLVKYCQSIGLTNIYTNWQEMLDKEKLDAVAIAVTPSAQYEIAKVAIKNGLHIFAEKPLAANYKQTKELLDLAKKQKIVHTVDFVFPEVGEWKKVKELLDKKIYGKLKQIHSSWDFLSYDIKNKISSWKTDVKEGGGVLSFYFSHCLYYLEYFAGEISNFRSLLSYSKESINGGETGVDLLLKFKQGVTGSAHLSCNTPGLNKHKIVFICERGTIILANENRITSNFTIEIRTENKTEQLSIPKDKITDNEDERVTEIKKLATRFINSIIHKETIIPSFKEGVRVQELIEEIRRNSHA